MKFIYVNAMETNQNDIVLLIMQKYKTIFKSTKNVSSFILAPRMCASKTHTRLYQISVMQLFDTTQSDKDKILLTLKQPVDGTDISFRILKIGLSTTTSLPNKFQPNFTVTFLNFASWSISD